MITCGQIAEGHEKSRRSGNGREACCASHKSRRQPLPTIDEGKEAAACCRAELKRGRLFERIEARGMNSVGKPQAESAPVPYSPWLEEPRHHGSKPGAWESCP
jgi:hypothetical protein